MKNWILVVMLSLLGCTVGVDESEQGQELRSGEQTCSTSDGSPCTCGTPACDADGTGGGGDGGGGTGGGSGADPYTRTRVCGDIYHDVCVKPDGYLYAGNYRRCCDYSTVGTPLGCYSLLVTPCGDPPL